MAIIYQSFSLLRNAVRSGLGRNVVATATLLLSAWSGVFAQAGGIWESYAVLSINGGSNTYYDLMAATANADFDGANLGSFTCAQSLVLTGSEQKIYKCNPCDITGGAILYRVYPTGSPSGGFTPVALSFSANLGSGCNNNDQTWANTAATADLLAGLSPGNYTVEVYNEAYGDVNCSAPTYTANNSGNNYLATFTVTAPTISAGSATTFCLGSSVTLSASPSSGVTYAWSDGSTTVGTSSTYNATASGTYTVTVTAANGCTGTSTGTTVTVNALPNAGASKSGDVTCLVTTADLTASSTTSGATFQWDNSGPATAAFNGVTAGTYTVTVTDPSTTCTNTASVTVNANTAAPNASASKSSDITCVATTADLTASSTTSGATFQWDNSGPATAAFNGVAAGTYTVTVTDPANGCTNTASVTVNTNTTAPDASASKSSDITCVAATANLTASSTTPGATFQWDNSGPATAAFNGVAAGTYTVTVTDPANGCTNTASVTVSTNTTQPDASISPTTAERTCLASIITLTASSTTPGVTYAWSGGSGSGVPVYQRRIGAAGTFTVTITDPTNGCTNTASSVVTNNNTNPNLSVSPTSGTLNCTNTSITITASSSTPGVTFAWSNAGSGTTNTQTATAAGTYTVTATDPNNGCTALQNVSIGSASSYSNPLSGTYTVGTDCGMNTLSNVVSILNTVGVSGPVVINVPMGYTETAASANSFTMNVISGASATNTVTIQRASTTGTNPKITAYVGTNTIKSTTGSDGIWRFVGTDYVTIDGIDLQESATNTTNTQRMEYGYGFFLASATNGCQYNTIQNCTITMNKANNDTCNVNGAPTTRQMHEGGVVGITVMPTLNTAPNARVVVTGTVAGGSTNSYNKFYGNTIQNVTTGIYLNGFTDPAFTLYDQGNDVGGTSAATGNYIYNFQAGSTAATQKPSQGVMIRAQDQLNVSYNTINNMSGGGAANTTTMRGIFYWVGQAQTSFTANNNNINLTQGANTANVSAIQSDPGAGVGCTMSIQNNTITLNNSATVATATTLYGVNISGTNSGTQIFSGNTLTGWNTSNFASGAIWGIYTTGCTGAVTMNNNTFSNIKLAGTGTSYFLYNAGNVSALTVNNNTMSGTMDNTGTIGAGTNALYRGSGTGAFYGFYNISGQANAPFEFKNNTLGRIRVNNVGAPTYLAYSAASNGMAMTVTGNTLGTVSGSTSTHYGLYFLYQGGVSTIANNTVSDMTTGTAGTSIMYGMYFYGYAATPANATSLTVNNNTVQNLSGGSTMYPFYNASSANTASTFVGNVYNNTIRNISTSGASSPVYGIYAQGSTAAGATNNYYGNLVSGLTANGATGQAHAWFVSNGGTATTAMNVYNNQISDIKAPSSGNNSAVLGISITSTTSSVGIYNNTIYLANGADPASATALTGVTGFGGAGIQYAIPTTGFTAVANNIVNMNITPVGTGMAACLRRSAAGTNGTAPATTLLGANNNLYNINTGANNFIYAEGVATGTRTNCFAISGATPGTGVTNEGSAATFNSACGGYKSFFGGIRENNSFTENNLVAGTTAGTTVPSGTSFAENGSLPIAGPAPIPTITIDFNGTSRASSNDIGASSFAGTANDVFAPTISFTPLSGNVFCTSIAATITDQGGSGVANGAGTKPRIWFKRSTDNNTFGTYPADNNSTFNGWKYVEASGNVGNVFYLNFDGTLVNASGFQIGDIIQYFIVAQDLATTPNFAQNSATLTGTCPAGVDLVGVTGATTVYSFTSLVPPSTITTNATSTALCYSGSSNLSLSSSPALAGVTYQWEQNTGSGWTTISGATNSTYATGTLTASTDFRCRVYCNGAELAASPSSTANIVVSAPALMSTTPGARCGTGTVVLGATSDAGSTPAWYAAASGGATLGTGKKK